MLSDWFKQTMVIAILLVPALTVASGSARAETIFLKCGVMNPFTVDLTNHTVNNEPANITPLSIDWETHGDFVVHLHIDRTAGTLTIRHSGRTFPADPCTVVSQPATKF